MYNKYLFLLLFFLSLNTMNVNTAQQEYNPYEVDKLIKPPFFDSFQAANLKSTHSHSLPSSTITTIVTLRTNYHSPAVPMNKPQKNKRKRDNASSTEESKSKKKEIS